MKVRTHPETCFSAKMVLLFALVALAMPDRRKSLEMVVKNLLKTDTAGLGQIPSVRIAGQAHFHSSFNH